MEKRRRYYQHQSDADRYAVRCQHPALIKEMRLGKCLPVIRRCRRYIPLGRKLRVLVAAPSSALGSWEDELTLEGLQGEVQYLTGEGGRKARLRRLEAGKSWNLMNKEGYIAMPEIAAEAWDAVVIDESTFLRNPRTKITRFYLKNFRNVPHRWLLTGTPNPEDELDWVTQLLWLDGIALGYRNFWAYRSALYDPPQWGYKWTPQAGTPTKLKRFLSHRVFVRRRIDVDMEVPTTFVRRLVDLPPGFRKAYRTLEEELILEYNGQEIERTNYEPVKYKLLRQLCGGFLNKDLAWRGKINALRELLTGDLALDPVVVWFTFNQEIDAVYADLYKVMGDKVDFINGTVPQKERRERVREFHRGLLRVLLVQISVAEYGMNLSVADTAIFYSLPRGTLAWTQTVDRILKLGKKGLLIIPLLVRDTLEEEIFEALQHQKSTSSWFVGRVLRLREKRLEKLKLSCSSTPRGERLNAPTHGVYP